VPLLLSGILAGAAAVAALVTVPRQAGSAAGHDPAATAVSGPSTEIRDPSGDRRLPLFLLVMALGTGCYVASEAGVSDWLVRYLVDLPVGAASLALTLFWAGIAVGRIVFARIGSRVDPLGAAAVLAPIGGLGLLVAFVAPVGPWTPVLFAGVGFAFGPFFPLMVAAAGARLPERSSMVATTLIFSAVLGAVVYPPAIGFISVAVGIQVAMVGTGLLALAAGGAAWLSRGVRA
jgi:fucose permease